MMEVIYNLKEWDRQTERLRRSAALRGDSTAEIAEMVAAREDERQRLVALMEGRGNADA